MYASDPQVSIIIPTFNSAQYLPETLGSILAQSYSRYEIILVDDGSTDNTRDIVSSYEHEVRYVRQDNSGGPARPRNVAIAQARGRYICIFDSDDLMMPEKLARSIEFLGAHPDLGLVFTNFVKFDDGGLLPGTHLDSYTHFWNLPKELLAPDQYRIRSSVAFDSLFYENYIGTSGVIAPAAVLRAIGPFDEAVTRGGLEDRDMWFRVARKYDFGFLNFVGHKYRIRPNSVSRRAISSAEARVKVIQRYLEPGLPGATKRQAHSLMADCLISLGYQHQLNGDLGAAREYFRRSLSQKLSRAALRGYLLSLLGRRCLAWLRSIKAG
jgi:glycosyltransferase involved in cell wall biosynthesis